MATAQLTIEKILSVDALNDLVEKLQRLDRMEAEIQERLATVSEEIPELGVLELGLLRSHIRGMVELESQIRDSVNLRLPGFAKAQRISRALRSS